MEVFKTLGYTLGHTTKVPISCSLLVDGLAQTEALLYGIGAKVEDLPNLAGNLSVAHSYVAGTQRLNKNADGLGYPDGVGKLYLHLIGYTGSHHVFGNMSCSIGGRAVYF